MIDVHFFQSGTACQASLALLCYSYLHPKPKWRSWRITMLINCNKIRRGNAWKDGTSQIGQTLTEEQWSRGYKSRRLQSYTEHLTVINIIIITHQRASQAVGLNRCVALTHQLSSAAAWRAATTIYGESHLTPLANLPLALRTRNVPC
jgi:hypothetical protein